MKNFSKILVGVVCVGLIGCASNPKKSAKTPEVAKVADTTMRPVEKSDPILLQVRSVKGREEITKYRSISSTKSFDGTQIHREKEETVDFTVKTIGMGITAKGENLFRFQTTEKEGYADLHDFAFPELNESIPYSLDGTGKVLSAGLYPKTSLFFVPPISLPSHPVEIGESWTMEHQWISLKAEIPMKIKAVSVLKKLFKNGQNQMLAEIEVSGETEILRKTKNLVSQSRIQGTILLEVATSSIVWSEIRSEEQLTTPTSKIEILSCLESVIDEPNTSKWVKKANPDCKPDSASVRAIPL